MIYYKINYTDVKEVNEILDMFHRDGVAVFTGDSLTCRDIWIPYDRPFSDLSLEERRYYIELVKVAKGQSTKGYEDRPEILAGLHKFFSDLCSYYKGVYKQGVEELETAFSPLNLPILESESTTLVHVSYLENFPDKCCFAATLKSTKTSRLHGVSLPGIEDLISPEYVSEIITETLSKRLEELDEDLYIFNHKPEKTAELRANILNFILSSDLISG